MIFYLISKIISIYQTCNNYKIINEFAFSYKSWNANKIFILSIIKKILEIIVLIQVLRKEKKNFENLNKENQTENTILFDKRDLWCLKI